MSDKVKVRRFIARVGDDFWHMLQARRPALYREVIERTSKPGFNKNQVVVTFGSRRAMISWPEAEFSAPDADRQVDNRYGDGFVIDIVPGLKNDTFMEYWDMCETCELVDKEDYDAKAKA